MCKMRSRIHRIQGHPLFFFPLHVATKEVSTKFFGGVTDFDIYRFIMIEDPVN